MYKFKFIRRKWLISILMIAAILGGFAYKTTRKTIVVNTSIDSRPHVLGFEQAINDGDLNKAKNFLDPQTYLILPNSECCGIISQNEIMNYISAVKPPLTFDRNSTVVQRFFNNTLERNDSFPLTPSHKINFDDFVWGANSNLDAIGYIATSGKATYIVLYKR